MLGLVGTTRELWRGSKLVMAGDGSVTIIDRQHDTGAITKTRYRFTRNGPALIWEDN